MLLESHGYEVEHCARAQRGLDTFCLALPTWTAVIVDLELPDGSGRLLISEMAAKRPGLPIIVHSGLRGPRFPVVPQEELHRFAERNLPKLSHRLGMFLDGYVQGVIRCEDSSRRHEAFQFGRSQRLDRFRIICQPAKNLLGYPLGPRFVGKVFLNPPASHIIGKLVHRFAAIDRLIWFDCLTAI